MINIIGKRYWFFLISGILILVSIVFLAVFGLKPGIEFSSGSLLTLNFAQPPDATALKNELANEGYSNAIIQTTTAGDFLIRTPILTDEAKQKLEAGLTAKFGALTEREFQTIDPIIARQTQRVAIIALIIAAAGILLYMLWAYRKVPKSYQYGTSSIMALLHDVVITIGIFSIFGVIAGWQTDLMFVTGILAILGYSVNNTCVVFDRVRENLRKGVDFRFDRVVNYSVVETIGRCLNTTVTTIITIVAVLLFVGGPIQNFVYVLLIGILVGTFDSIFVAPSLLVVWEQNEWGRFLKPPATIVNETPIS